MSKLIKKGVEKLNRIINVEVNLNKLNITGNEEIPQNDKNTHFINLTFDNTINLAGYQLLVMYKLPYPSKQTLVDTFDNLTSSMNILIPNNALKLNGYITVEFALKKLEELITVNKGMTINVISSLNGTSLEVVPTGNLNKTIEEKIESIKALLESSKTNLTNYVDNTSKPSLDKYVNDTSKIQIDNYVKIKEKEIEGATFTPQVSQTGELTWTNNKGLVNPTPANIMGPIGPIGPQGKTGIQGEKGQKGDTPLKGVDYYTPTEKQQFKDEILKDFDNVKLNKGNLPNTIDSAENLFALIEKNTGATFNKNLLYLNDAGTKEVGKLYFDKNKQGVFKCIQTTTATVNSTTNFVDISNLENHNKLENLRIVWEEITRAVEPITFDGEGYFKLTKPFTRINTKTNRRYDFYYANLIGTGSSFNNSIIPIFTNSYRVSYLGSLSALCLDENNNYRLLTFSSIDNNVSKIKFNQFLNQYFKFREISFYGGYISNI